MKVNSNVITVYELDGVCMSIILVLFFNQLYFQRVLRFIFPYKNMSIVDIVFPGKII